MNLVNIALSGLSANRVALGVTAQNVANVNTPGYSRQQALLASVEGEKHNILSPGMGTEVTSIRRVTDQFLVKQVWLSNSLASYAKGYSAGLSQLENTFGADGLNLSAGLDSLNAALNDATVKPESIPYRQQVINEAEALAQRFNTLSESLHNQNHDLNQQREAGLENVNTLLANIASLNKQLAEIKGIGGNPSPLLDARDSLIGELSQWVEIRTTPQPNGGLQVSLAAGQPLVMGADHSLLRSIPDKNDTDLSHITIQFSKQQFIVNHSVGGELGAMQDYQKEILQPHQVALDDMAKALSQQYNSRLAMGIDLNGQPGKPLFDYNTNSPAASLSVNTLRPADLAFSSDGAPGNADVLNTLIQISNKPVSVTGYGQLSLNDAFGSMVGEIAIKARQANADLEVKSTMNIQVQAERENISSVNGDEEAANLMTFSNAHNANVKVISTANQLFDSLLQLF
ncbi:flagellar hook-associated protein FlgK [Vibrio sagamiensis]|uniref:Flagellar hook-associated protein 1 n=1 Tax=Vibrio sagamiensis NBRC 104589 TaxID=1219064 RepID=A0A511QD41_9VIBR|nr:flagellar hook-associated protein FlgK [Vibrio sagamiensis]PNQ66927.1 flagellar hook-associated protein FlgK [Vibrio agarivorans]GEM75219.1 flagellar hook-associated protein 1 [Vibrio sagamiensis NBRC 104589]